ncbi:hypothetical protein E4U42_000568 [Claviceps africana]|uniref:Major facilitator superfamily transporter n=1 Tax=Claviceps africana TaxID=83212 RepID=A0A8K0JAK1_9HYPO|nr:hypothetical protein E4U42_000568 [Claviceps africana]
MGILYNPLRSREKRLPLYQAPNSPAKERYSDDEYDYSDEESEASCPSDSSSPYGSRHGASGSAPGGLLLLPKKKALLQPIKQKKVTRIYPYRLPAKVTRYVVLSVVVAILLMILSLVRASQVENWKVANGKVKTAAPQPHVWETFPFLERYYGGIRTIKPLGESEPSYPHEHAPASAHPSSLPLEEKKTTRDETSPFTVPPSLPWDEYPAASVESDAQECFLDAAGKVRVPPLRYHHGRPHGFPGHVLGSYEVLKLPEEICLERYGRYGPYGLGYSKNSGGLGTGEHGDREGSDAVWDKNPRVDYRQVDWADVQRRCFQANARRYKALPSSAAPSSNGFYIGEPNEESIRAKRATRATDNNNNNNTTTTKSTPTEGSENTKAASASASASATGHGTTARTAVVIRCWDDYLFREDDMANIRAMVAELSMASGGRYDVHLLVQVKEDGKHPIWADREAYERRINETIPAEFQGLVTLWTETQMLALYQGVYDLWTRGPDLPVHGVYRGLSMAMQHFAYQHPEYDYFWQWEMDIRYTGHYYDLVTKLEQWARAQPRKGLWERNSRFYLPSVHGSWEDFSQMSRVQSEMGVAGADNVWQGMPGADKTQTPHPAGAAGSKGAKGTKTVWGPVRPSDEDDWFETDDDDVPPTAYGADKYAWGVGEEADYISLNPLFDPDGTTWMLRDDITGFNRTQQALPPRRAALITTSRMSRRLLLKMHRMTAYKKQFAFPEMWPATVALQHGYKAVAAPHPVYVDRRWPVDYMAQMYNAGRDGSSGGSRTSVFGEREHNLLGLSWFYNSGFAPNLYRRWLGLRVNNDGGDDFELTADESRGGDAGVGVGAMPGGEGRMCIPPMLLHPVKDVELPVVPEEEEWRVESDPSA